MTPWISATVAGLLLGLAPLDGGVGVALRAVGLLALAPAVVGRPLADLSRGAWVGVLWYGTSLLWFPLTWARFDSVGDPWLAYIALIALQAVNPALSLGLAGGLRAREVPLPLALALGLVAAAGLAESVMPLPAGLPVYLAGHEALIWPASWGGPAAVLLAAGLWAGCWGRPLALSLAAIAWVGVGLWTPPWASDGEALTVGIVQPNAGPLDARRASTADRRAGALVDAIRQAGDLGAAVVFTPEGAWPHDPGPAGSSRRDRLLRALEGLPPTLLGASVGEGDLPHNALLAVVGGEVVGRYDKVALLPLGERAVLGFGRDTYAPGLTRPDPALADAKIAARICYEDLLPSRLAGLGPAELLATPSNDGWLGPGSGSGAHEAASRLAAVSAGRWVVRPTTNGRSAVFDPAGRRHLHLPWVEGDVDPPPAPDVAVAEVRLRRPALAGADVHPWLTLAAALAALVLLARRRAIPSPPDPEPR